VLTCENDWGSAAHSMRLSAVSANSHLKECTWQLPCLVGVGCSSAYMLFTDCWVGVARTGKGTVNQVMHGVGRTHAVLPCLLCCCY